ncbi:tetratricopeptide repeat protein [Streptomyces sp. NPDC001502]|uniref:tetratricopeptide repeat protein n=1 Tax=Streptomyces sp. NPDC001502 TaxID=3364578 RepID=UPI00368AACE7
MSNGGRASPAGERRSAAVPAGLPPVSNTAAGAVWVARCGRPATRWLGDIHRQLGRREAAVEAQTEALAIRRRMNDLGGTADCLAFMARTHHQFGERDAVRACWEQCLDLGLRHGMTQHIERSRAGLAAPA